MSASTVARVVENDRRLIAFAVFVATFLVGLDTVVITTAMPSVVGQLGGLELYSWVFSIYLLASTVTVPIYGKLADLYGRKPTFLASTTIFLVGSMLCGQSQSMEQLIFFRLIQGIGAGGVQPVTFTIIGDVFPLEERARMTGIFSAIWGISSLIGPAIGGFLTEQVSWRWVFYVNLPLCLLSLLLIWRFLHERVERRAGGVDYPGVALLSTAVVLLLLGLQPPDILVGVVSPALLMGLAALLLVAFVWQERRAAEPLLPLGIFRNRIIAVGSLNGLLIGVLLFGQSSYVPPFVQGAMGASPTLAGFILSCTSIGWPLASTTGGRLIMHWGYRRVGILGGLLLTLGFGALRFLSPDDGLLAAAAIQAVIGGGFGFLVPIVLLAMQNTVPWEKRGVVTGTNQFSRSIGGTLGVSLAGAMFAAAVAHGPLESANPNVLLSPEVRATLPAEALGPLVSGLTAALEPVYTFMLVVAVLSLVVAAFLPGGHPSEHTWTEPSDEPAAVA